MSPLLALVLQALILGTGIYLALGFLRQTRGGGILRGLVIALLVGAIGLWSLTELLRLEELGHILESATGYVVVILVILFQPELRRGIAQLGEHALLGRHKRHETVSEVAQAATALAKRRRGALIAFERDFNLDAYVDNAVRIDGQVTRLLLESVFHPGGTLHDGAVVIRGDRVAAAACLFPLTENLHISRSTGTRHRAALGLTEETDAVTLVVSEETGEIALCRGGEMQTGVAPERLESSLRELLGRSAPGRLPGGEAARGWRRLARAAAAAFTHDLGRKIAAAGLAAGLLFLAHRDIHVAREYTLQIVPRGADDPAPARPGELVILLPSREHRLVSPARGEVCKVTVSGTRAQVDALGPLLSGELVVPPELAGASTDLDLARVDWGEGVWTRGVGLRAEWTTPPGPHLRVERIGRRAIALRPDHLDVDAAALDPRFRPDVEAARFAPAQVEITGPEDAIERLDTAELPLQLERVVLDAGDTAYRRQSVRLAPGLRERRFAIAGEGTVQVTLPIVDALRALGSLELEIQLVALAPPAAADWTLPEGSRRARFGVRGVGILPPGLQPGTPEWDARAGAVCAFLRDHLRVFADTTQLEGATGAEAVVRWILRDDWRAQLDERIGGVDARARLEVVLESDKRILLRRGKSAESGAETPAGRSGTEPPGGRD